MFATSIGDEYKYDLSAPKFQSAFKFLSRNDLADLPEGQIDLDYGVFANIQHYITSPEDTLPFETHDRSFDIQYMVEGEEYIGVSSRESLTVSVPYDKDKDISYYQDPAFPGKVFLHAGDFLIVEPECAHKPRCCAGECKAVKKIVIKVPV